MSSNQWIEGCVVQRINFHDGFEIKLGSHSELLISVPMRLTLPEFDGEPGESVLIDAAAVPSHLRPLLGFSGSTCTRADWDADGNLHLEFSEGHTIDVPSDEHGTAWELYGKHHGYIACLPGGDVRVVRHDLPAGVGSPLVAHQNG